MLVIDQKRAEYDLKAQGTGFITGRISVIGTIATE
jgi:hypothetical protein